jgi:hypothetical protein
MSNVAIFLNEKPMLEMLIRSFIRECGTFWRNINNIWFSIKKITIFKSSFYTSRDIGYDPAMKINWFVLCRETINLCCENHTKHTNTLCGENAEF